MRWLRIKHLLMIQLGVGLMIILVQLAIYCWNSEEWWKLVAFDCAILAAAVFAHLWASLTGIKW